MPRIKMQRRKAKEGRAAIYARVSDQSQDAEDKTSISEQISDMEAHCERRGLTIVATAFPSPTAASGGGTARYTASSATRPTRGRGGTARPATYPPRMGREFTRRTGRPGYPCRSRS